MAICNHIYMNLHVYKSCIYKYAFYCTFICVYLYFIAYIYADICVYRCILACIWSRPTLPAILPILPYLISSVSHFYPYSLEATISCLTCLHKSGTRILSSNRALHPNASTVFSSASITKQISTRVCTQTLFCAVYLIIFLGESFFPTICC